ncbi:MAG: hypothetical protein NTW96_01905 [Planctomycetia bacterium]|nr:hypothetical protein [Planctomycetia bacterium]
MPDIIHLDAQVEIQAAADGKKVPTVTMTAYSGGLMTVPNFGRVVIDLDGLQIPEQVPFLADHEANLRGVVGQGEAHIASGTLLASGTLPPTTEAARQIVEMAKGGFKFGASVGVQIEKREFIASGQSVSVNGQTISYPDGGFTLVRAGTLREISIVALAADSETSVSIAASLKGVTVHTSGECS